jgi:type II secretory pathway predicted ATPase ExeA
MTAAPSYCIPDPLLYDQALPRCSMLFPLGQALEAWTNSELVETALEDLWIRYPRLFDDAPMVLRIAASGERSSAQAAMAVPRGQGHLVSMICGSDNFAIADLSRGFGYGWITPDVAEDRSVLVRNFLEPIVYMMVSARHFAQVHASCVALDGRGVLLCGESGTGKTCLAYACARAGWQFISGDAIQIVRSSGGAHVVGRPWSIRFRESARRLFPELGRREAVRSAHGKIDIELDTAELGLETAVKTRADHVVLLNRVEGLAEPRFEGVCFDEAFAYLEQVVFYGDRELRQAQKRCLAELLQRPVLRLSYSNLSGAERALRRLLD